VSGIENSAVWHCGRSRVLPANYSCRSVRLSAYLALSANCSSPSVRLPWGTSPAAPCTPRRTPSFAERLIAYAAVEGIFFSGR
jgi:hypothetical protein